MTLRPVSISPTRTRIRICYRHPDESPSGICASCLRERLSGLNPSKCDVVSARRSLSNLFDVETRFGSDLIVESKNLGISTVTYNVIKSEPQNHGNEIRASNCKLGVLDADYCVDSDGEVEEGEIRTMKEYIDLEFQNKVKKFKDSRGITGNLWGAASAFSNKLRKWGQKSNGDKIKKVIDNEKNLVNGDAQKSKEDHSEIARRRSCDNNNNTEPRFSVDAGRISFEKPRASWDGYMIARTIPRLAPMFSAVENGILGDINRFENHRLSVDGPPMHSIMEDESSSAVSGNSNSDSSSSMRQSSFDRSSSAKSFEKKETSLGDHGGGLSPVNVKLVITEKELKDWHLSSSRGGEGLEKVESFSKDTTTIGDGSLNNPPKKSVRWHRVRNVFSFRPKNSENKFEAFGGNAIDPLINGINEKQGKEAGEHLNGVTGWKLTRSSSVVGARKSCDVIKPDYRRRSVDNASGWNFKRMEDFNMSTKHSSTELEDGMMPFYMTPLRSLRRSKSGKFKLQNSHLQLN